MVLATFPKLMGAGLSGLELGHAWTAKAKLTRSAKSSPKPRGLGFRVLFNLTRIVGSKA